ncbi:MAG: SBBP repeat-containing protein [Candidatus Krumholzibacteriota bacterium]|nr:SBBP repeat-containing protein [Candidatus Krumholzibacteriota bacterium]
MRTLRLFLVLILVAPQAWSQGLTHAWSQRFGDANIQQQGRGVTVDSNGNVLVTGYFEGSVDFGGGPLASAGSEDIFVAKYDASGVHQWSQGFAVASAGRGHGVAVDASGNVAVAGRFAGTVDFGGGNLVSAGFEDIFVAKYDASGVHQWSQRFGGTGRDVGWAVAVDAPGNVVVTGRFLGTVDFGGGNLVSAGASDIFVAKYDASGVHQWSRRFGGTKFDKGQGVAR